VENIFHEDREVWVVKGSPKGAELVRACSVELDRLSGSIRNVINDLGNP
jgi:hypothetical protein